MKTGTSWIKDLLEETMYNFYLENHPQMVSDIKKLLIAGEPRSKIKKHCEQSVGRSSQTSRTVANMIDYVDKQIKN